MGAEQIVTLTGDDAALFKAYQRIIDQQIKMEKGLDRLADRAKKAKKAFQPLEASDFAEANAALDEMGNITLLGESRAASLASQFSATAIAVGSVTVAIQYLISEYERLDAMAQRQLQTSNDLAKSQFEAVKNMVTLSNPETQKVLVETIPQMAVRTGFSDQGLLTEMAGTTMSILPKEKALQAVELAARVNQLTPDQAPAMAAGIADLMKNAEIPNANEALALAISAGGNARPDQMSQLTAALARGTKGAILNRGESQSVQDAAREGAGLTAFLTGEVTDVSGDSTASNQTTLLSYTRSMFGEFGREDRDKRLKELNSRLRTERDKTAREAVQKEIADITAINAATINDPGSISGRLETIANTPELRRQFLRNMPGEAIFKPVFEQLVTPGSDARSKLAETMQQTTFDSSVVDDLLAKQKITPNQQIGNLVEQAKANRQAVDAAAIDNAKEAAIRNLRNETLQNLDLPMSPWWQLADAVGNVGLNAIGIPSANQINEKSVTSQQSINDLKEVLDEVQIVFRKPTETEQLQINLIKRQIELMEKIQSIEALPGAINALNDLLSKQQNQPPANGPAPANANTINAAQQQRKGL